MDGLNASRTGVVDGIPSIKLDIGTQKRIIQSWNRCVIGKVVGKR